MLSRYKLNPVLRHRRGGGGGGGFTRPIPGDGAADQLRGISVIGRLPTDGTRGPKVRGYGRIWPDADGPVQGSLARDEKGPVIQNHSGCMKESINPVEIRVKKSAVPVAA